MKKSEIETIFKDKFTFSKSTKSGGNAQVYFVKDQLTGQEKVLKILNTSVENFEVKAKRFEIETLKVNELKNEMDGIIPIYEFGLNDVSKGNLYWYTMPTAIPLRDYLDEKRSVKDIVESVIELANTLSVLHEKDIVHRDIKPENLYYYEGHYCLGDFGLVDYPNKDSITKSGERIGANATMAPEMKINAKYADAKKADVYSLAKTLWMLITKNKFGFEGVYTIESDKINLEKIIPKTHWIELAELLNKSTQYNPEDRPSMINFKKGLVEYLEVFSDDDRRNLSQWRYVQNLLFGKYIPDTCEWTDINDIVDVLNVLSRKTTFNHMFFPSGGGLDFEVAELASEKGFICIKALGYFLVKPKLLRVENIGKDYIWSYFRLELYEVDPIEDNYVSESLPYQQLTEDVPGNYVSWKCGNYGYYENDQPLPVNYRMVERYLRGSFVIFSKFSIYNEISATYDARHDKMDAEEFRAYITVLREAHRSVSYDLFMSVANKFTPFKEEKIEEEKIEEEKVKSDKLLLRIDNSLAFSKYVDESYLSWDFSDLCIEQQNDIDSKLSYYIHFHPIEHSYKDRDYYLSSNGKIEKSPKSVYQIYDRSIAKDFVNKCIERIGVLYSEKKISIDTSEKLFDIEIKKIGKPIHLFTKIEIEDVMRNGDDSRNNILVIDEKGYAKLITSDENRYLYPVSHESFSAYNNLVGKYSKLSTLDDEYISSLQGWLMYLQTGESVYMDYVHENTNEDELLKSIKKYY